MAKKKRTTIATMSGFAGVFAPLPQSIETQIRSLLPKPEPANLESPFGFLRKFEPEGWNSFAELMWNIAIDVGDDSAVPGSLPQSEVDTRIAYLDEEFGV